MRFFPGFLLPFILPIFLTAHGADDFDFLIDEIEVTGNTVFPEVEIIKVLEFGEGDRIERKKVVESSKNVQELYRLKGYDDVGIEIQLERRPIPKTKAVDHVLEVKFREGLPSRVSVLEYRWPRGKKFEELRRLERKHAYVVGDIFDQEKLEQIFKAFQDDLGSLDFMGAKVELEEAITTAAPVGQEKLSAAKWVSLRVAVDVGERVTFGFRGNAALTHQDLNLLIDRKSTRLNSSHSTLSRMPSSA